MFCFVGIVFKSIGLYPELTYSLGKKKCEKWHCSEQ